MLGTYSYLSQQFGVSLMNLGVIICPNFKIKRIREAAHNLPDPSSTKCCPTVLRSKILYFKGCGYLHYLL